jgi:hypothetical protein
MSATGLGDSAVCGNFITDSVKVDNKIECKTITCESGIQTLKTAQADSLFLTTGQLDINGLATSNPGIAGRVWNDGGTLKIS